MVAVRSTTVEPFIEAKEQSFPPNPIRPGRQFVDRPAAVEIGTKVRIPTAVLCVSEKVLMRIHEQPLRKCSVIVDPRVEDVDHRFFPLTLW